MGDLLVTFRQHPCFCTSWHQMIQHLSQVSAYIRATGLKLNQRNAEWHRANKPTWATVYMQNNSDQIQLITGHSLDPTCLRPTEFCIFLGLSSYSSRSSPQSPFPWIPPCEKTPHGNGALLSSQHLGNSCSHRLWSLSLSSPSTFRVYFDTSDVNLEAMLTCSEHQWQRKAHMLLQLLPKQGRVQL